ncbi:hypothetical protein Tco_0327447 [Tanacetum coccineum]
MIGTIQKEIVAPFDLTKPLPLKGRPGRLTVATEYFFNNDLEFLKSSDPEKKYTTSITNTKATSVSVKKLHGYGHLEEIAVKRAISGLEYGRYGVLTEVNMAYQGFFGAQTRRIFLDGYGVLDVIIVIFKCYLMSSKTKRIRTKESESSKKPSTTKETSKGKAPSKSSKTSKSATTKEPIEEPTTEVEMDDAVNTAAEDVVHDANQPHDDSTQAKDKALMQDWFKQPPRPPTPNPKRNKRQVVLDQPEQPWFNQMVSATKDPLTFNDLMATPIDFSKYAHALAASNLSTTSKSVSDKLNWNNPEGYRYPFDMSKPFPLQGRPGHLTISVVYFFNNDLEYLKTSDPKKTYTTSITKIKSARGSSTEAKGSVSVMKLHGYGHLEDIMVKRADQQLYKFKEGDFMDLHFNDIEDMLFLVVQHKLFHLNDSDIVDFIVALRIELYTLSYKPPGVIYGDLYKLKRVMRADELYKFLDGTLKTVHDEIHHRILDFCMGYNKEMSRRKWTDTDKKRPELMVELIDKQMRERRIIRNLERLVGARKLEMDYILMTRTV